MEIESVHKYIALNKQTNGSVEVMFAGQPCLIVSENSMGMMWRINPVFTKLVYGANIFEDIPVCTECHQTMEEAVASGLLKLYDLGAFRTEVDFPEDTYAATMNAISEEVKTHALTTSKGIQAASFMYEGIMKSIKDNTFGVIKEERAARSEYTANLSLVAQEPSKNKVHIKKSDGSIESSHASESDALKHFKTLNQTSGLKIVKESLTDDEIDKKYSAWEDEVRSTHSDKKLELKGRVESGKNTVSAEVAGKDRSYGVWDHDENEGTVFPPEDEKESEGKIQSILKKDKTFEPKKVNDANTL